MDADLERSKPKAPDSPALPAGNMNDGLLFDVEGGCPEEAQRQVQLEYSYLQHIEQRRAPSAFQECPICPPFLPVA